MFQLLDRIAIENEFATIKYVGYLPDHIWGKGVLALGIEWDIPERGKNDGTLEGTKYFEVEVSGAGTFIKASNKKISRVRHSFVDALLQNYNSDVDFQQGINFGTKIAEGFGFAKLNQLQSDFQNLRSVSLQRMNISSSFGNDTLSNSVLDSLVKLQHLDLSFNLLNDVSQVWEIVLRLPSLKTLILNGNRFSICSEALSPNKHLNTIKLSSTNIPIDKANLLIQSLPELKEISLAANAYTAQDISRLIIPPNITQIDFSHNKLHVIPELAPSLTAINLSNNQIGDITGNVYPNITNLDIRHNQISKWQEIDKINLCFPGIRELRINHNPTFDNLSVDDMTIQSIARFDCSDKKAIKGLNKLNGSFLNEEEITNAELYFISKVLQNNYEYNQKSPRWQKLLSKHDIKFSPEPTPRTKPSTQLYNKKISLILNLPNQNKIPRVFLIDNTILRVKGVISKYLNRSVLDFEIYYYVNEFEDTSIKLKQFLDDGSSIIDNYGFHQGQNIYAI